MYYLIETDSFMFFLQTIHLMKHMSICVSTTHSNYQISLHAAIGGEIIHSIDHGENTVYLLIHSQPRKSHATVDKGVAFVDQIVVCLEPRHSCLSAVFSVAR